MTGYLTTVSGEIWRLPELLQWEILRTDGTSCDSARVVFLYEPVRLDVLKNAVRLRLEENGKTEFFGVVDEFTAGVGSDGRRVELSCRGLMALLMDSQLPSAQYAVFQKKDAEGKLLKPFGVDKTEMGQVAGVRNFSWDTGTTPWQALCGYLRHAGAPKPRFSADGTLLLQASSGKWSLTDNCAYTQVQLRQRRYGVIARQVVVTSGGGQEVAENKAFQALGGTAQKVAMKTGKTLKATWRTGKQRIEDAGAGAFTVTVTLPGCLAAEPGDTVQANLERAGVKGDFILVSVKKSCSRDGMKTVLELEGGLG